MFFRVIALAVLFIIRLRFPTKHSLATIIRSRYGDEFVKLVRKFEKIDFRCRKLELDLNFLEACSQYELCPTFLRFKVSNSSLKNSSTYKVCQAKLLQEEITNKSSELKTKQKELRTLYNKLKTVLTYLDFGHVHTTISSSNEKAIKVVELTQNNKLEKLLIDYPNHNSGELIYKRLYIRNPHLVVFTLILKVTYQKHIKKV